MKSQNLLMSFLAMFLGLSLVFTSQYVLGQDAKGGKEVKVKIVQKVDGDTKTIEKSFSTENEEDLKNLLKEFDVNIDEEELFNGKQVEISIRKTDAQSSEEEDVAINLEKRFGDEHLEEFRKAFLGVVVDEIITDDSGNKIKPDGVVIAKVLKETAAEKAGLKEGDLITKVNETEITDGQQFIQTIFSFEPGDEITIHFEREGKEGSVVAKLEEKMIPGIRMPYGKNFEWQSQMPMKFYHETLKDVAFLGVFPGVVSGEDLNQEGVLIGDVIEESTAAELGLKKGDVIMKVNDKSLKTFSELREVISNAKVGDEIKVEWQRDGQKMIATASLKSKADCKTICEGFDEHKMANCGDVWIKRFKYDLDENKAMSKESIEETIEKLEGKIEHLKEQLQQLSTNEQDRDEKTEETKITITIEDVSTNNLDASNLLFSPNPNNGKFNLNFELPDKGKTVVKIFDAGNKEIYSETLGKFSGRYDQQIDVSENPKGIYFLQITQDNKVLNKKIVIQ